LNLFTLTSIWKTKMIWFLLFVAYHVLFIVFLLIEDHLSVLNLLFHEHIAQNGRFHWKASCNKFKLLWNYENASILMKLGTYVDETIASVTACSIVNFLLLWQRGTFQNCQKTLFCIVFFSSKLISKCCNFSMNWNRVKGFSASVTSYPKINLRPFLACHMSKIFLTMRGNLPPLNPPKHKGAHPPSDNPLM
jgi:hypothetical protein